MKVRSLSSIIIMYGTIWYKEIIKVTERFIRQSETADNTAQ